MKLSHFFCALLLSSLLITSRATSGLTISAYTTGTTADSSQFASASSYTVNSGTAVTPLVSTQLTGATVASNVVLTVKFAATPLISNFQYENDGSGSAAAVNYQVNLNLGNQVAVVVSAAVVSTPGAAAGTITVGSGATLAASATAVTPSSTCGTYYLDCAAGTLYFSLATGVPGASSSLNTYCTVQVNQIAAIVGVLQFPTATVPSTSAVQSTVAGLNSLTSAVTTVCGTSVPTGTSNTLYYFISTYGTSTSSSDQTTNFNKIKTAASTMGINSNTGYYVNQLATNAAGTTTAPSATAAANLTAASKSSNKYIAFVGIFTTVIATLFGIAL